MKIIASVVFVSLLSGCAAVDTVKQYWPRNHDPIMVSRYIDLSNSIEKASCGDKSSFDDSIKHAEWLNKYSEFRSDPQKEATTNVVTNLKKASEASEAACKRWVNLANINMKLIKDSWSSR